LTDRRHTLVIGGSKGIGRALVRVLAENGDKVSVVARTASPDDLPLVTSWVADVADARNLERTLASLLKSQGPVSGAVLLQRFRGEGDDWEGEFATSLTATRNILEWIAEHRQERENGTSVVIIGSAAGTFVASEQALSYHVAKAAIAQMARYYAVSYGPKGVRVNVISPGTIVKEESRNFYKENPELVELYRDIVPLGRMGTAQDVADLAQFLLSDRASFLTGQIVTLDGGISLHWHESLARRVSPMKDLKVTRPAARKP